MVEVDWFSEVITLRDRVEKLKVQFPAEALTVCRKAMEVIQFSLFYEKFGKIPESHVTYRKMMDPSYIGEMVSKTAKIEFNTIRSKKWDSDMRSWRYPQRNFSSNHAAWLDVTSCPGY